MNVVQVLAKLKLSCVRVGREKLFEVPPLFFWSFGLSDVTEHVIMMQRSTTRDSLLAPKLDGRHVLGWVIFVRSFNITPIALDDKVLMHLVVPRCEVVSSFSVGRALPI